MIYITGDTHGDFERFGNNHFSANDRDYLIICGDFGGIWDDSNREKHWLKWLSEKPFTTLFVDGNHENYDLLQTYPISYWNGGKVHFINDRVLHLIRGQVFNIEGMRFFTMGGASSHDINAGILEQSDPCFKEKRKRLDKELALYRINHISWWSEEMSSEDEMKEGILNLQKNDNSVDYVLSHCAPTSVQDILSNGFYKHDQLTDYLEIVKASCEFKYWFFGHYHDNQMIGQQFVLLYDKIVPLSDFL